MKRRIVILVSVAAVRVASASSPEQLCPNAMTTREIEECLAQETARAESDLNRYLAEARRLLAEQPQAVPALDRAQASWLVYRDADCKAAYELYAQGTIRGAMFAGCKLTLTQRRTHDVWETYIRETDSSLPEPATR